MLDWLTLVLLLRVRTDEGTRVCTEIWWDDRNGDLGDCDKTRIRPLECL